MPKKYEQVTIKFNLDSEQDVLKWNQIKGKGNKQQYIKDLILLDVVHNLFQNAAALGSIPGNAAPVEKQEEEPKVDLRNFDTSSAVKWG